MTALDSMEVVMSAPLAMPPFLHCMPCGVTHMLWADVVTVAALVALAETHECQDGTTA